MESQVLGQDAEAQKMGINLGKQLAPQGQNLIGMGTSSYQPVLNYWSSLLSGNRGQAASALSPEISRIGQGYKAATDASASLMPRGGTSAEFNAELPYQQQRDVSSLLQTARPQAATNLFNTGNAITGAGSSLLNNAISSIYGSTAAGRDILTQQQQSKAAEQARASAFGKNLFGLINTYGPDIAKKVASMFHRVPSGTYSGGPDNTIAGTGIGA
jgi:hypothetical protein